MVTVAADTGKVIAPGLDILECLLQAIGRIGTRISETEYQFNLEEQDTVFINSVDSELWLVLSAQNLLGFSHKQLLHCCWLHVLEIIHQDQQSSHHF